jgi:hypothetical protein
MLNLEEEERRKEEGMAEQAPVGGQKVVSGEAKEVEKGSASAPKTQGREVRKEHPSGAAPEEKEVG